MTNTKLHTLAGVLVDKEGISIIQDSYAKPKHPADVLTVEILDSFSRSNTLEEAYSHYESTNQSFNNSAIDFTDSKGAAISLPVCLLMANSKTYLVSGEQLVNRANSSISESIYYARMSADYLLSKGTVSTDGTIVELDVDHTKPGTLKSLLAQLGIEGEKEIASFDIFKNRVNELIELGALTLPVGSLDWGLFKRTNAICPDFGSNRGTPVDRYYLDQFIDSIKPDVTGHVLEIGGHPTNRDKFGFVNSDTYTVADLIDYGHPHVCGDIQNVDLFPPNSFDTIVLFNVLEHVAEPQRAVHNIYRWLKPNGKVFCMVPNAQRVHHAPKDYWRPMPDALDHIFSQFKETKVRTYGNVMTTVAALLGVAAEELSKEVLDHVHRRYPVIGCVSAIK
jgi:hypothetical protein